MTQRSWFFLVLLLLLAAPALAQPKEGQNLEKAKALFKEAEISYRVGEYAQALDGYRQAYLLSQASGLLYNMAQCQRNLGLLEDALRSYRFYLQDTPASPYRVSVEKTILELDALVKQTQKQDPVLPALLVAPASESVAPASESFVPASESVAPPAFQSYERAQDKPGLLLPSVLLGAGAALGGVFWFTRRGALSDQDFTRGEQGRLIFFGAAADVSTLAAGALFLITYKKRRALASGAPATSAAQLSTKVRQ